MTENKKNPKLSRMRVNTDKTTKTASFEDSFTQTAAKEKKETKALNILLPKDKHTKLKMKALERDMSMTDVINELIDTL